MKKNIVRPDVLTKLEKIYLLRYNKLMLELNKLEDEQQKNEQQLKLLLDNLNQIGQQEKQYYSQVYTVDFRQQITSSERKKIYSVFTKFIANKTTIDNDIAELNEIYNLLAARISDKKGEVRKSLIKKEKFVQLHDMLRS